MRDIVAQLGLLAQGLDGEDWVNLLILVVIAFFWLIGALAKALSRKKPVEQGEAKAQQRLRETWQERLARKVEEMQRAAEARSGETEPRTEEVRSREQRRQPPPAPGPGGRVTVRTGPRGESIMVYEHPEPQAPPAREQQAARQRQARRAVAAAGRAATKEPPTVEPKTEAAASAFEPITRELSGIMAEPTQPAQPTVARQPTGVQPLVLIDPGDPDALRTAILHYEILGKPVALRRPSEQTMGL